MHNLLHLLCWFPTYITKSCNVLYCIFSNVGKKFHFLFKEQVYSKEKSYYNSCFLFKRSSPSVILSGKAYLMGNKRFPPRFPTSHTTELTYPGTRAEFPDQTLCSLNSRHLLLPEPRTENFPGVLLGSHLQKRSISLLPAPLLVATMREMRRIQLYFQILDSCQMIGNKKKYRLF